MKLKKRSMLTMALSLALVMVAVVGTVAYMTSTASVENIFTIGGFIKPSTPGDSPEPGFTPDNFLVEPNWDAEKAILVPGDTIPKDPYVGIGKGSSDDAVVYLYIDSDFAAANEVYFEINPGWEAVAGETTNTGESTKYTGGLFKYSTALEADADHDVWTAQPLFSNVVVASGATFDSGDDVTMTVHAFLHQANDAGAPIDPDTIDTEAKNWAATLTTTP